MIAVPAIVEGGVDIGIAGAAVAAGSFVSAAGAGCCERSEMGGSLAVTVGVVGPDAAFELVQAANTDRAASSPTPMMRDRECEDRRTSGIHTSKNDLDLRFDGGCQDIEAAPLLVDVLKRKKPKVAVGCEETQKKGSETLARVSVVTLQPSTISFVR
jgi:hypothetical protein